MLDGDMPGGITVGRTLSSWTADGIEGGQLRITYTVYNEQGAEMSDVLLATTLAPGVDIQAASLAPDRTGQDLSWDLGAIPAFGRTSVELTLSLPAATPLQIDTGARASGALGSGPVSDEAPAAALRPGTVAAELLAATADANTNDPFLQEKAAELDYDPARIFAYLRDEVGFESYVGSLRGSRGTLWSGAGNALDEASLGVALLRASGIPAQYARGTLSDGLAQQLILTMFPEPLRLVGCIDPNMPVADPANDPALLAEARDHAWIQYSPVSGGGLIDADATIPGATLGQTFATATATFAEVPDDLRHKVTLRLDSEVTQPGLLGPFSNTVTVLEETFPTAELVGRPVSIGHFVSTTSIGSIVALTTNTYSPYFLIGGDTLDSIDDPLVRGTDYQEVLTNFPFSSQVVTGLFLEMDVRAPDGSVETYERTLADRIGLVARRTGQGNVAIDSSRTIVSPLDVTTVSVLGGEFDPRVLAGMNAQLDVLRARFIALTEQVTGLPPGPENDALGEELTRVSRAMFVAMARSRIAQYEFQSDAQTAETAAAAVVRAYFDSPRLTLFQTRVTVSDSNEVGATFAIDLRQNEIRAVPAPGQNPLAAIGFNMSRGGMESILEALALGTAPVSDDLAVATRVHTQAVLDAAQAQGIGTVQLLPEDRLALDVMEIPPEAKLRIGDALDAGKLVLVPARGVEIDGRERLGWYEIDPASGHMIGVMDDGGHQAEGVASRLFGTILDVATDFWKGALAGALLGGTKVGIANFVLGIVFAEQYKDQETLLNIKEFLNKLMNLLEDAEQLVKAIDAKRPGFLAGYLFGIGQWIIKSTDPPTEGFLFSPPPLAVFETLGQGQTSGIAADVVLDPLFTHDFEGAQLPTMFRVGVKNVGPTADRFRLDMTSVPAGFTAHLSTVEFDLPAGTSAEIGICLIPTAGAIPAAGTPAPFQVRVASTTDPSVTATVDEPFVVPDVHGLEVSADPVGVATTPGMPVEIAVLVRATGNVAENVALTLELPAGLTASAVGPITVDPGQMVTVPVTLTPEAGVPLNSTLRVGIRAEFGVARPIRTSLAVKVAVPGAESIAQASIAADQLGNTVLADRLDDLSIALTSLVQAPASEVARGQALAALDSILSILAADPVLSVLEGGLSDGRDALAAASTPAAIQDAVRELGDALDEFGAAAMALTTGNFQLFLSPNSQVGQPQVPAVFPVVIHNIGTETTTYDLSLSALPPGVTGTLSVTSVTLDRDEFATTVFVTITPTSTAELAPFSFTVQASPAGFPGLAKSAAGSLTARNEFVSVVEVTTDPPFADPGASVNVSARLLNAVNRQRSALASFVVRDAGGAQVFASTPVPADLTVQTSLTTVALGTLDTTGLALGNYTIEVSLVDAGGRPIPGATGRGTLLVGSPVGATLSVGPDVLPTGTSTVTDTLVVASQTPLVGPLGVLSQTDLPGAGGVARNGQYVYASGSAGITVYNITDPSHPQSIRTFGSSATTLEIRDDRLYALTFGGPFSRFSLMIYSLNDPESPQFLGNAQYNNVDGIPYSLAWNMVVTDTHVFASLWSTTFLIGAQNDIKFQTGDVIAIDVADPTAPTFVSVLRNTYGTNDDGIGRFLNVDVSGGDGNLWEIVAADDNTLLVAGSTAAGDDTQTGNGVVHVIDVSDPAHMAIVRTVVIPGTVQAVGLSIQENHAFVVASQGGFSDPSAASDLTGNLVLATLDITDPRNPSLLHSEVLDRPSAGPFSMRSTPLGNGLIAFSSFGGSQNQPAIYVVDASDPAHLVTSRTTIPAPTANLDGAGNFLYATSASGLIIYQIDAPDAVPATARVEIPKNTGVSIVPGSFSVAPTRVIPGTDSDTLVFDLALTADAPSQTITWQSTVSGLQPGEAREVTLGTTIDFTSQGTPGQVALPPTVVAAEQILALDPATQAVRPGEAAPYTLTLTNPTATDVTYNLSIRGVPDAWVDLPPTVTVAARGTTTIPVILTPGAFDPLGTFGFVINATAASGASGSVQGELVLDGVPVVPVADPDAHGVVLALIPGQATAGTGTTASYVVRVVNTGSATELFTLSTSLPPGVNGLLGQTTVEVPSGASNFRDITLSLTPQAGASLGANGFTVTAAAGSTSDSADGTLTVVANGVDVALSPTENSPGGGFQLMVTNSGSVTDTFGLALAGPGALVASLGLSAVTLGPGASQMVPITTQAAGFALPGALSLTGIATSLGNPAVRDAATADLRIAAIKAIEARFDQPLRILPGPGSGTFRLFVENTGNLEDSYTVLISGTSGPVAARIIGLDGLPTRAIPQLILPGPSSGSILLQADLAAPGQGTIIVQVTSLTDGAVTATATATVATTAATNTQLLVTPESTTAGQPIALTAVVTAAGQVVPGGAVTFAIDGTALPPVPLAVVGGQSRATLTVSTLIAGSHVVTATYGGIAGFETSVSDPVSLMIQPAVATDTVAPTVTTVERFGYHMQPTRLVVSFSEDLAPAAAENPASYRLVARGRDRRFGTADDRVFRIVGASYDHATQSVTLRPSRRLPLGGTFRLTVGGVTDHNGNILDGDGDGQAGGTYTTRLNRQSLAGSINALRKTRPAQQAGLIHLRRPPGHFLARAISARRLHGAGKPSPHR
jgi:uncharacterized membrane protein